MQETETKPIIETDDEGAKYAHYVRKLPGDPRSIQAVIIQAIRNQTPLMAICGFRWVPKSDAPAGIPVCPACIEVAMSM